MNVFASRKSTRKVDATSKKPPESKWKIRTKKPFFRLTRRGREITRRSAVRALKVALDLVGVKNIK